MSYTQSPIPESFPRLYNYENFSEVGQGGDDCDDYSDSQEDITSSDYGPDSNMFTFGDNLMAKGNFLTVADDLIKNNGKKFIEMMEHMAERRLHREEELENDRDYEEEEDEDGYDDEDEYDEEIEAENEGEHEARRIREGKRMFQVFAARMFEQRLRQVYREKMAQEKQCRLTEELEA